MPNVARYEPELRKVAVEIVRRDWKSRFGVGLWVEAHVSDDHEAETEFCYATPALDSESRGICVVRGPGALRRITAVSAGEHGDASDGEGRRPTIFGFAMVLARPLSANGRKALRRKGGVAPAPAPADGERPWFFSSPGGGPPQTPTRRERRLLLAILNALVEADDLGRLRPARVGPGAVGTSLSVYGDPRRPEVEVGMTSLDAEREDDDVPF